MGPPRFTRPVQPLAGLVLPPPPAGSLLSVKSKKAAGRMCSDVECDLGQSAWLREPNEMGRPCPETEITEFKALGARQETCFRALLRGARSLRLAF